MCDVMQHHRRVITNYKILSLSDFTCVLFYWFFRALNWRNLQEKRVNMKWDSEPQRIHYPSIAILLFKNERCSFCFKPVDTLFLRSELFLIDMTDKDKCKARSTVHLYSEKNKSGYSYPNLECFFWTIHLYMYDWSWFVENHN